MNERINILLVEDNPSDAELTIRALRKKNIHTGLLHLKDGEEALDYIFATGMFKERNMHELPKLILLDIKMPKVDGLQVLKRIKGNEITKNIPVVLLTSSKEDFDIVEGYKYGANSFIVKPVDFDNFVKVVTDLGLYWLATNTPPG